ncbi:MAG: NADH-quinone oxidoreductase subunit J [Candidatus Aminicenantes bacterium]|nr:NADH-quinone oxidoreductase subunit J [Candidatus Aminicenantes bacterium]
MFFILAIICVGAVLAMILTKNPAYSALWLVLAFLGIAGIFGLLDAPFIAAIQIIIYAGAIMVLFIFVIMMIDVRKGLSPEKKKWTLFLSGFLGLVLLFELITAATGVFSQLKTVGTENIGSPAGLGRLLFTDFLYPFEITSVLIIAALVGAIVLAKKKENE